MSGTFLVFDNARGSQRSVTVTIDSSDGIFVAPGQGVIYGVVGRLVSITDESDPTTRLVILQSNGIQDPSPFPAVCSALAIGQPDREGGPSLYSHAASVGWLGAVGSQSRSCLQVHARRRPEPRP